ncbi:MAG TPA: hypothetical protein VGB45_16835 [Abditibacterium sp.]|jgi:hypothetical protein
MNYQQLDKIADVFNPLLILALILASFKLIKGAPWTFLFRSALAVILSQQIAKFIQKRDGFGLGDDFPSTHFAVALALWVCFWLLSRKGGAIIALAVVFYGALMLFQRYHTPLEMAGAVFAVPLALLIQLWPRKARRVAN